MPLLSILSDYLGSKKVFFEKILDLFDGYNREWWILFKDGKYTKCFFPESVYDILKFSEYKSLDECEFHFSVQRFSGNDVNRMFDWDFIIDIDGCSLDTRKKICLDIMKLLDSFNLVYLVDSRFHIWFPNWIHSCIEEWNKYFSREYALYMKYFLEITCNFKGKADVDSALWYTNRHKIRVPYTFHLKDNSLQVFYDSSFQVLPFERLYNIWTGKSLHHSEIYKYNKYFLEFLDYAFDMGKVLFEGFNFDRLVVEERVSIRNKELRPCFSYHLEHNRNMSHKMRMATVLEAVCAGYSDVNEIAMLFSRQKDFNLHRSVYHVVYLLKNTKFIKPYRCSTIKRLGWCIGEKCKYYRKRKR